VNPNSRPFRINIGFLVNQPIGAIREFPFEFKSFTFEDDFTVWNLTGKLSLARTMNGIRALADFSADTDAECGRCVEPFKESLHTEFEEIFTFENRPLSEEEETIREDGNIDFEALIREYLILSLPIKPVCSPDCKGLCIICGQNLNEQDCGHSQMADVEENDPIDIDLSQ
jgi:uncharacterized protein